ncbi:MAG: maltose ABC transporter substrate-binding protein [Clostridia bacterium]|nr:maltose ABC transporter substrate-binding protein [Clostridia bacterium]
MFNNVRKRLSTAVVMLLVAALAVGSTGCGKTSEAGAEATKSEQTAAAAETTATTEAATEELKPEAGAKLKVWDAGGSEKDWMKEVTKKFEEQYGVPVKFEGISLGDIPAKLKTDAPAKLAADVFCVAHDNMGGLVKAGLVYPNDVSDMNEFVDAAKTAVTYEGVVYGYPATLDTYAMFYNKKLIKEAPKTFDEIIEYSKTFNDLKQKKYGFMFEVGNLYFNYAFVAGFGGYVFGKDGTDANDIGINNEGTVEAFKYLQKIKEILPLNSANITYDIKNALFKEGKLAFDLNGPWAVDGYRDAKVDFGVCPLPTLPNGKQPVSFSGVRTYFVNSYTQYPNAAKLFAKFITSKDMLKLRYTITQQIPPRVDLMDDADIKSNPMSAAFLEQAKSSQPMPSIPEMSLVWPPVGNALQENWNKGGDPKPLLDKAVQNIKDSISRQAK